MPSVLDNILANIQTTATAVLTKQGYAAECVVLDEFAILDWPPEPDELADRGASLIIQVGPETERPGQISNADAWQVQILLGLTVVAKDAEDTEFAQVTKDLKTLLITALRADRQRGRQAENTLDFVSKPWSFGDGSMCGFAISFKVNYRTNYNQPNTVA
jgi:hypothetical protein